MSSKASVTHSLAHAGASINLIIVSQSLMYLRFKLGHGSEYIPMQNKIHHIRYPVVDVVHAP